MVTPKREVKRPKLPCDTCPNRYDCGFKGEFLGRRLLAKAHFDRMKSRLAEERRLTDFIKMGVPKDHYAVLVMEEYKDVFKRDEDAFLRSAEMALRERLPKLTHWCDITKGLGPKSFVTFAGFICPYRAETVGDVRALFMFMPGTKKKKGRKTPGNPFAKGKHWMFVKSLIMAQDSYYYPYYKAKKVYLENNPRRSREVERITVGRRVKEVVREYSWPPFGEIFEDPTKCPKFEDCEDARRWRAERLKKDKVKPPGCKGHRDGIARMWLGGVLLGNALEVLREEEGLPVGNIRVHRNYIAPKEHKDQLPDEELIRRIEEGRFE